MTDPFAALRARLDALGLDEADLDADPIVAVQAWLAFARTSGVPEPDAMTLATVDAEGRPSARAVLLRGLDDRGFVFFTNRTSEKARAVEDTGRAALSFLWSEIRRQVRVEGTVERVGDAEVEARFAGQVVPRPPQWGGYRVVPERIELWQGREARLHDRLRYERSAGVWRLSRLAP